MYGIILTEWDTFYSYYCTLIFSQNIFLVDHCFHQWGCWGYSLLLPFPIKGIVLLTCTCTGRHILSCRHI